MIETDIFTKRIDRGVDWLDENVDGWLDRIDLERLDLNSTCNCVLGQLFADDADEYFSPYLYALDEVAPNTRGYHSARDSGDPWQMSHGFEEEGNMSATLTRLWAKRIIELRQERDA